MVRQGPITLSTAESELMGLVEAMVAGESVFVVLAELLGDVNKVALCDSQAALAILVAEGGSLRTRHLHLRWASRVNQCCLRRGWQVYAMFLVKGCWLTWARRCWLRPEWKL